MFFNNYVTFFAIIIGFLIDCVLGDPQNPLHPIRFLGVFNNVFIKIYDKLKIKNSYVQFIYGMFMNIFIVISTFSLFLFVKIYFYKLNFYLGFVFEILMSYFIIAPKALLTDSMKVYKELEKNDILKARFYLSHRVGRDTQNLNEEKIIKATVETIVENLSDGVISPLIYLFLGGVPLGMAYKAISTLDSMVGYKNEKFIYFGRFSARLDDVVNFLPARVSAICIIISSFILKLDFKNSYKIYVRDRYNHLSPNAAHTEAACAGALNIELGGASFYGGKLVEKKTIGDKTKQIDKTDIILANKLMYTSTIFFIIFMIFLFYIFNIIID